MRNLFLSLSLLLTMFLDSRISYVTALGEVKTSSNNESREKEIAPAAPALTVNLNTATGKTIRFRREAPAEDVELEASDQEIPHLVLNRNGVPTPGFERTLLISVDDLVVPPSGMYVQLVIETQHGDPDLDRRNNVRIPVWKETTFVPFDALEEGTKAQFRITFDPTTNLSHRTIKTPTDYYRYRIIVSDPQGSRLTSYAQEYAFLMENQWRVPLPEVLETTPGAAPDELLVYYYDMTPFQSHVRNPDTQIPRQEVDRYIQAELIPQMVKAFETQTNQWDLPWYEEWSNYRVDEDPKTLSVALGSHGTWFHGAAPSLGHAMISIRVDGTFGEYSSLTDGIMSVFHHELFHNQQRNISLHFGSKGNIAGQGGAWKLFSEGTAVLASSVGQPAVQFGESAQSRSYIKRANAFIGADGAFGGGLNKSYKDIPYHTALYWRFLYENCGGLSHGVESPAVGMQVIRRALETLYKGEVVQINASTDVAGALPRILDDALASTPSCAFDSYEESLVQFSRAIYKLRLENGRCLGLAGGSKCAFVDPHDLYQTPPAGVFPIAADSVTEIRDSIRSSYGIDFVELAFDPTLEAKTWELIFTSAAPSSEFQIQLVQTKMITENGNGIQFIQWNEPVSIQAEDGSFTINMENPGDDVYDRLGLIITRMDPYEETEATGAYTIRLRSR